MRVSRRSLALWASSTSITASAFSPILRSMHSNAVLRKSRAVLSPSQKFMSSSVSRAGDHESQPADQNSLRVALCQFHVTHDKSTNHQTASAYLKEAASKGAELIVLPEIWNSPYATAAFPEYAEDLPCIGDSTCPPGSESSQILMQAAKDYNAWIIGGSIPENENGKIYNTCLVFNPRGEVVAKHRKVHLFDIDVPGGITFFESDTLSPGSTLSYFNTPWGNIGVGICYDIRFPEYAMLLSKPPCSCRLLVYPGAFNMTTGPAHWELLQRARALDNQCFVVTASPARSPEPAAESSSAAIDEGAKTTKYPHYTAWGHSTAISPWGEVVATTDEKEGIVIANLELSKVEEIRKSIPIMQQKRIDMYELTNIKE